MTTIEKLQNFEDNLVVENKRLRKALDEAVALLCVEARAYRDNDHSRYTSEQRQNIAETLRRFCDWTTTV